VVPGDVVVVGADELQAGRRAWIHEEVAGRRWRISARSFFQARPDGADALVAAVTAAAAGADGPLVDLYAGVGLFAGSLGRTPATAVEWSSSSVADARVNLDGTGARIRRIDVTKWKPERAGLVVADPARTGLGRVGAGAVAGTHATRLVLVSCDPAALARDARVLAEAGFALTGTTLVDLFPHTTHVEAVSRFERSAEDSRRMPSRPAPGTEQGSGGRPRRRK
jgi:23S rRNA (uracil1939-C5)-methyltransferase